MRTAKNRKKFVIFLALIIALAFIILILMPVRPQTQEEEATSPLVLFEQEGEIEIEDVVEPSITEEVELIVDEKEEEVVKPDEEDVTPEEDEMVLTKRILQPVPFTSQAPFGDWQDQRQQDGCEEASILMAIKWARGESLTKEEALREITTASDYTLEKYGEYRDTDLDDALAWLVNDYFSFENAEIRKEISKDDLIAILSVGQVIVAPMNGQALKNPNFTAPGPLNHMLLIRGYDQEKKVFITNDPGTRKGELYEYDEDLLYSALRAYPSGYKELNEEIRKSVIVFWK